MTDQTDMRRFIRCLLIKRPGGSEQRFILDCLKKKDISWGTFMALAQLEGVSGLLYFRLKAPALIQDVPPEVIKHLEKIHLETDAQSRVILSQIESLSHRFGDAELPVMAIQGLSVVDIYDQPGLRPLGDADLLVKPESKGRLRKVLWEAGYTLADFRYVDLYFQDGMWLDIHTHILNLDRIKSRKYLFPEDLTSLWERAVPFSERLPLFLRPEPVDNFIVLAAHALKHSYSRLIWLVDLYEFLLKGLNWQELTVRARFWRQEKVVLYALILVEAIFHLNVPLNVKDDLGVKRLNRLEKKVIRLTLMGFTSSLVCHVLWLLNIKGIGNQMKFIRESVFPEDKVMAQIFPKRSGLVDRLDYARRAGGMTAMIFQTLYQTVRYSIRKNANE